MRREFHKVYQLIEHKMTQHYRRNLELYLHSYRVMVSNRSKMETVRENTQLRLIIRSRSTMER